MNIQVISGTTSIKKYPGGDTESKLRSRKNQKWEFPRFSWKYEFLIQNQSFFFIYGEVPSCKDLDKSLEQFLTHSPNRLTCCQASLNRTLTLWVQQEDQMTKRSISYQYIRTQLSSTELFLVERCVGWSQRKTWKRLWLDILRC